MTLDKSDNGVQNPIVNFQATTGLTDYFCPFCDKKLFRGKVKEFNMVCSNCNKLVRSSSIKNPESSDQENSNKN